MIRYKIPHNYIGPLAACLCLALSATSCVDDEAGCLEDRPGYVEGNDIWLSFTIKGEDAAGGGREIPRSGSATVAGGIPAPFAAPVSRADDPSGHPEEPATDAENAIKSGDLRLLLFDNNKNLLKILDNDEIISFTGAGNQYEIKAKINRAYFDYAGTAESFGMSLMLVANLSGFGGDHLFPRPGDYFMKSTTWLSQQHFSFAYSPTVGSTTEGWYPDETARFIPMAGLKHYTVSRADLDAATDANAPYRIDGGVEGDALILQRSVAKIRVFDNINRSNADAKTVITAVRVEGLNTRGAFMPDFSLTGCTAWADGTTMVEKATVDAAWFSTSLSAPTRHVAPAEGGDYTDADGNTFTEAFVAYIPEADLRTPAATSPKLVITTEDTLDGTAKTTTWELTLSDIIKESVDITRNHIYEFTVTRSTTSQLDLMYTVCPWLSESVTIPPFD